MNKTKQPRYFRLTMVLAIVSGLPGILMTVLFLILGGYDFLTWSTVFLILIIFWGSCLLILKERIVRPWQIISNVLGSFRENDYSLRGSFSNPDDPIGLAHYEVNQLADELQKQRRSHLERHRLFQKILHEIDVAVFCFDQDRRLVLVNSYGAKIFGKNPLVLKNKTIEDLGLDFALRAIHETAHYHEFPSRSSRWLIKHGNYREGGMPHQMILLADIKETLREEELIAWKRLIRVLGHEINNSLTPLKTMSVSMNRLIKKDPLPDDWKQDFSEGMEVISDRVDNLSRFVASYSKIARQPTPKPKPFSVKALVHRLHDIDQRKTIQIYSDKDLEIEADESQIEQVLINLFKNAIDATDHGIVSVSWIKNDQEEIIVEVIDEGAGILNMDNLFVPYFTTKEKGNGIGLFVSRQIIEAHCGSLSLNNRKDKIGCIATIRLPMKQSQ